MFFGSLTPEQIAQIQAQASGSEPAPVVSQQLRCDSCQQFMTKFNSYVESGGKQCHLYKECLEKFSEKYWEHTDFHKPIYNMGTGL